ncbi:MAG: type I secretion C-terminal target domain-containing protein [Gammaproteobacteria bacterium]|nr:type I secretion C-terminal target domain-containing protein [Gammaproteobacteria bacterium]
MTVTFLLGTLTHVSTTFINPYTGELLAIDGDYYINDTYVYGGPDANDVLIGTSHDQFYRLEDDMGNLLLDGFEQFFPSSGNDILLLASTTNVLGDLFIQVAGGDDIVWSNAGNDIIGGDLGNDILHGGPGNDDIDGGGDNDILTGGQGNDTLDGGSGIDAAVYSGAFSNYVITDSAGILTINDTVGTDGTDTVENVERIEFLDGFLEGGVFTAVSTDDTFIGTAAVESFDGGLGIDTVDYSASSSRVKLDMATGGTSGDASGDTYISIENIIGTNASAADYIYGDAGDNYIQGLAGGDGLEGGAGADTIDGGSGNDYARYTRSDSGVDVDLTRATQIGGDAEGDVLINIEHLKGSDYNDILTGDSFNNHIRAEDGNDTLSGGIGNDRLWGGLGDDTYIYSVGKDRITEKGDGYDSVVFDAAWSPEDVVIAGNVLSFIGNTSDKITFSDISSIEAFVFDGFATMDLVTLQSFSTPLSLTGTGADDVFVGTVYAETFDGSLGTDTVDYSSSSVRVMLDMATGGTSGEASGDTYISIENIIGSNSSVADYIDGDAGDNYIQGMAGGDELEGGAGADTIDGGSGNDYARYTGSDTGVDVDLTRATQIGGDAEGDVLIDIEHLRGSDYDDVLTGDSYNNHIRAEDGDDVLSGGAGDDRLWGSLGNDTLYGGSGSDQLDGGAGADTFVFEDATAFTGIDEVRDFSLGEGDVLDISDLLSGYDALTDAISDFVQITDNGTGSILSVDVNGGADNFVQIATLTGITGLTDEDALELSGNLITV